MGKWKKPKWPRKQDNVPTGAVDPKVERPKGGRREPKRPVTEVVNG